MGKIFWPVSLLFLSNAFMTLAWYGHLKFKDMAWSSHLGLFPIIVISWGVAFFEYCCQVPANRLGFTENGGAFNLWQLKVIQEVISLVVFMIFMLVVFRSEPLRLNHVLGFALLLLAVFVIFKK